MGPLAARAPPERDALTTAVGLKQFLEDAHAYAVFPSVGKAALVIGGAYGKGLVFKNGEPIGFATIGQTTIGVQIGGDTFTEIIAFESRQSLERCKRGKIAFSANASAVLIKAGAAGSADYEKGVSVFVYASGGMLLEAAIGGQKFKFKPLDGAQGAQGGQSAGAAKGEEGEEEQGRDEQEEGEESEGESQGLLGRAITGLGGGIGGATSKVTGLVKKHPVATLVGASLVGLGMLALRSTKSAASTSSSDQDDQSDDEQSDEDSDQEESSGEDESSESEMDYDEEDDQSSEEDSEDADSEEEESEKPLRRR